MLVACTIAWSRVLLRDIWMNFVFMQRTTSDIVALLFHCTLESEGLWIVRSVRQSPFGFGCRQWMFMCGDVVATGVVHSNRFVGQHCPVCRKTQPHTRTLGNFPEHLTYQVVSGIRLCSRDTYKRNSGLCWVRSTIRDDADIDIDSVKMIDVVEQDYWSTSSCVCFNCRCI